MPPKSIISGAIFCIIGITFLMLSFNYSLGSISNMGPAFFPITVSVVLIICGILLLVHQKND